MSLQSIKFGDEEIDKTFIYSFYSFICLIRLLFI